MLARSRPHVGGCPVDAIGIDDGESEQLVPSDAGREQCLSIYKAYGRLDDRIVPIGIGVSPGDVPSGNADGQKYPKPSGRAIGCPPSSPLHCSMSSLPPPPAPTRGGRVPGDPDRGTVPIGPAGRSTPPSKIQLLLTKHRVDGQPSLAVALPTGDRQSPPVPRRTPHCASDWTPAPFGRWERDARPIIAIGRHKRWGSGNLTVSDHPSRGFTGRVVVSGSPPPTCFVRFRGPDSRLRSPRRTGPKYAISPPCLIKNIGETPADVRVRGGMGRVRSERFPWTPTSGRDARVAPARERLACGGADTRRL